MSDDEVLDDTRLRVARRVAEDAAEDGDRIMTISPDYLLSVIRAHDALTAERDLLLSIAERYADGWTPLFHVDPAQSVWEHWDESEDEDEHAPQPITPEQVAWFNARGVER